VFKLNTAGAETVQHTFTGYPFDGANSSAPVTRDRAGRIYGTTTQGGSSCGWHGYGCGTVFRIDAAGKDTVLYSFTGGSDGCKPLQGLIRDKAGTVYGTTAGCPSSDGTIFKVDTAGNFVLLHSFAGESSDGANPFYGHLAMDKSGNLYGVTTQGGAYGYGVLYRLSKSGTLTLLHSFDYGTSDGCNPYGSVVRDKYGNFYGTTSGCGSTGYGTIWKVSATGKETILHNFAGGSADGGQPEAGVARDSKGNLYGVTLFGGANNLGTLYKLDASGRLTLLHSFSDGAFPLGEVLRTANGTLVGTTQGGGTYGNGTVWSYVP
jgi:uncharacterized repeat protein (TIGR03803 family)